MGQEACVLAKSLMDDGNPKVYWQRTVARA